MIVATRTVSLSGEDADGAKELRRMFLFSGSVSLVVEWAVIYASMSERNISAARAVGMPETRRVSAFDMVIYSILVEYLSSEIFRNRETLMILEVSEGHVRLFITGTDETELAIPHKIFKIRRDNASQLEIQSANHCVCTWWESSLARHRNKAMFLLWGELGPDWRRFWHLLVVDTACALRRHSSL